MEWTKEQKKEIVSFAKWAESVKKPINRQKTDDEAFKALWKEYKASRYEAPYEDGVWKYTKITFSYDQKDKDEARTGTDDLEKKYGIDVPFVKEKVKALGLV